MVVGAPASLPWKVPENVKGAVSTQWYSNHGNGNHAGLNTEPTHTACNTNVAALDYEVAVRFDVRGICEVFDLRQIEELPRKTKHAGMLWRMT